MDTLKTRLREGNPLVATFSIIPAPEVVELVALAGFDAIILDMEHGSYGTESLAPLLLAARARGIFPLVRVRNSEPSGIGAALDAGAAGVIVPQIGSLEEARRAVAAARFAPAGNRGANPFVRAGDFGGKTDFFAQANAETAIFLMVEGQGGVAALPDILRLPALDGIFIGPVDLSHALGHPGETTHPEVVRVIEEVISSINAAGLTPAIYAPNAEAAHRWIVQGARLVGLGGDTGHLLAGLRAAVASLRIG